MNKIITRKFALIPDTYLKRQEYKKITDRMVKFRDLENIHVHVLIRALRQGQLTLQNFERTSNSFIKGNIYDRLNLTGVRATQFKSLELKERMRRCATENPFHAVRNWLVRNYNLANLIAELESAFSTDSRLIFSFLLGKSLPKTMLKLLYNALGKDVFGNDQNFSYFYIDNMVGQVRNLFLEHASLETTLKTRLGQIRQDNSLIEKFLKALLIDFSYKKKSKKIKLQVSGLPEYFLNRYFISLKSKNTRKVKNKMSKGAFKRYKHGRDVKLALAKKKVEKSIKNLTEKEVWNLLLQVLKEVFQDYSTNPNLILIKHVFKPFFIKSPVSTSDYQGFIKFFSGVLQNKIREHFKELFTTNQIISILLNDLNTIRQNISKLTRVPEIHQLSIPIIAKEQIYKEDYSNLRLKLSFIEREFINLTIQDRKGTIASLLGEGADPKVPVITFRRRKLILNLPFEVQRKAVSKQAQFYGKRKNIEIGVDLGLKHFAVLSVMDNTSKTAPEEIDRYFIGSKQLFDMKFDANLGKFIKRRNHGARNNSNIKLKLIHLRENITIIQRKKNEYEVRCTARGQDFKKKLKFNKLSETLSVLWERSHDINKEIVRLLNHHVIAIAKYHGASSIKMENLKFSKHSKKKERGSYLAFWQTHWLFGQIQDAVKLQAYLHDISFKRVNAAYTSQRCPECGLIEYRDAKGVLVYLKDGLTRKEQEKKNLFRTKSRSGKRFTCQNALLHETRSVFRLDADLIAARNIALS